MEDPISADLLNHAIQALKRLEEIDQNESSGRSSISAQSTEQHPASTHALVQSPLSDSDSLRVPGLLHSNTDEEDEEHTSDSEPSSVRLSLNTSSAQRTRTNRAHPPSAINTSLSFAGRTLSFRRSTSRSSLQAARLSLQVKEPQYQPDDFLLAGGIQFPVPPPSPFSLKFASMDGRQSVSVPPSPGRMTGHSITSSGPPPISPLPPVPRSPVFLANRSAPATPTDKEFRSNMSETKSHINGRYNSHLNTESKTRSTLPSSHSMHRDGARSLKSYKSAENPLPPLPRSSNMPNVVRDFAHSNPSQNRINTASTTQDDISGDESRMTDTAGRPGARHADLATWASGPDQDIPVPTSDIPNLPDWNEIEHGAPTAVPNRQIQRDMDYSLRRLLNLQAFEQLLNDPLGRHRFRDHLLSVGESTGELDMWQDLSYHARLLEELHNHSEALHDIYLDSGSHYNVKLPPNLHREVDQALRQKFTKFETAFDPTQQHLLDAMYHHQFQGFVKQKLVQQAGIKLGKHNLTNPDGLGDCFCLTNPRLRDHPIVLVSDSFNAVTGYPRNQIVGRNCRFLQGPGTAPEAVQRIRDGLNSGEGCTELLLNYRRDGSPFYCLLCIIPLRDQNGQLVYFLGGQTNVTNVFAERKSLSFLITGTTDEPAPKPTDENSKYSPAMLEYTSATGHASPYSDSSGKSAKSASPRGEAAAGSVDRFAHFPINEFGLAPFNLQNSPMGTKLGGMIGKLFKKPSHDADLFSLDHSPSLLGTVPGTAASHSARDTEAQHNLSSNLYSKLIIFKKQKREVIFVTKDMLAYLGLPHSSYRDLYSSPLVHSDLVDCLTAGDKGPTKMMRTKIKNAIKADESMSVEVGLKVSTNWGLFPGRNESLRTGILHMTPLKERSGQCVAYVCVFG